MPDNDTLPDNAESGLLILDRATVQRCAASFDPLAAVEVLLKEHASDATTLPAESYMEWHNRVGAHCRSIAMPGGVPGDGASTYGVKIINAAVSNPAMGLDRAGGVTLLFDPETARPRVIADAGYLSALRTATYTLVSLRHLGPSSFDSVSLIGCGTLAKEHLRLFTRYQPEVSRVYLYDLDPDRSRALSDWIARHFARLTVTVCDTARQAAGASPVLITLTTSRRPYIEPDWLPSGSFVAHVSLDDVTEEVFLRAEAIFADDIGLITENPRRILGRLMAEGKISQPGNSADGARQITGTLGDVLLGRRESVRPHHGVVVSNPFGMSILDIGLLAKVARMAEAERLGQRINIDN